jgi:RNA polymerase sigma-70 factor, ECF subfamily
MVVSHHEPMEPSDEPHLIRSAQKRDLSAFAILVQRHHADVRACLAVRLNNTHDAEDLAQEVFMTAFRRIGDCDPTRPIRPWFRGIAMKLLANFRRKSRPELIGSHEELQALLDAELEARFTTAHGQGNEGSELEALVECLEKLENPARNLLRARYEEGESLDGIAARLGRKASAVSMQLHRLRVVLGDCVKTKLRTNDGYPSET